MEITEVDINKIRPDPDQPRQTLDEEDLKEMAQSILTTGIINAIEVDKNLVIITGERRWRASRIIGLKTVPVKILEIGEDDRFMRQVIENIHHNTMSDHDTAYALKKLWDRELFRRAKQPTPPNPKGGRPDIGATWLVEKTGKSLGYIEEKLKYIDTSKNFQNAVKTGKVSEAFIRVMTQVPEKFQPEVEKKLLKNEFRTRDGAREFVAALKREEANPQTVEKLLSIDYSKHQGLNEVKNIVTKISPRTADLIAQTYEPSQEISKIRESLSEWLTKNPKETLGLIHAPRVVRNLNYIKTMIDQWFAQEETQKIEGQVEQ